MAKVWVALLRAVNLAGRNRVPMAELRAVLAEAGCGSVATYIQSGNAVFTAPSNDREAFSGELAGAIRAAFGVETVVILRTAAELEATVRSHPFGEDTAHSYVTFLAAEPAREAVRRLEGLDVAPDEIRVRGAEVYLRLPAGISGAQLTAARLERELGVLGTNRNWRTVLRLHEMATSAGDTR